MGQGLLPCQYAEETSRTGLTALAGVVPYLELLLAAGVPKCVAREVGLRRGAQGWTDSQKVLEKDAGLCAVLRMAENWGLSRGERQALADAACPSLAPGPVQSPCCAAERSSHLHHPPRTGHQQTHVVLHCPLHPPPTPPPHI